MSHFANLIIGEIQTLNLFSAVIDNLFEFQILIIHEHSKWLNAILRHICGQFCSSFGFGTTILLESINFLPQSTDRDGSILVCLCDIKKLVTVSEFSFDT